MKLPLSTEKMMAVLACSFALGVAVIGSVSVSVSNHNRVVMGVQSGGQTLSGMTENEVRHFFLEKARTKLKREAVVVTAGQQKWNIHAQDIDLTPDVEGAVEAAYGVGRHGSLLKNTADQMRLAIFGADVKLTATFNKDKLAAKVSEIATSLARAPQNATLSVAANGGVEHHAAVIGRKADADAVVTEVAPKLESLALTAYAEIPIEEAAPAVTDADLASADSVLASYTTHYFPGDRGQNIAIAAGKLSGITVKPSGTFSFNDTVGARTADAGYKTAGVILDGQPAEDIGGGVCQVSSTLYNAILLAGLTPTVRTSHALPSAYCPPGLDATVADGLIDFQFQNRLPHSIHLLTSADGNNLTVYVLGTRADLGGKTVQLESDGNRLHPSVYRLYLAGGEVVEREFLHTDSYSS
ncbi:MAG: VanW family protein [Selenomonas sp.]|uniref:VanW family protein n=1 Tax=Selenomonas sp. TaxID=2053611 RepID=UPI0025CD71D1|nr:VanW family protein [Selenomonas sp.]MCI6086096.1 VanW family protein [Selenomonas sp.]MDY4414900.1 VanW family protein [Selenomonas sp.]